MTRNKKIGVVKAAATLIQLYETLQNEHPERLDKMEKQRQIRKEMMFGSQIEEDPIITKTHKYVEKQYLKKVDRLHEGPPLIHIRFQYSKEVVQSRYKSSVFSTIVHEADNVMDKITGDDDDSDYETSMDLEESGGLLTGIGISKAKPQPEIRILVLKVTNVQKIPDRGSKVKSAQLKLFYENGHKKLNSKSLKKVPDYKHQIGFQHVFTLRGLPIEEIGEAEIKLSLKLQTEDGKINSHILLSPHGCEFGEVEDFLRDKVTTSVTVWKEYLETATEHIIEYAFPLINGNHSSSSSKKSTPTHEKSEERKKSIKTDLMSLFN